MLSQYLAGQLAHSHNLFSVYSDVGRLAGNPAYRRLVNQDAGIRKRESLAVCACRQEQRSHRSALADADCGHVRADKLHRIVDCHACRYRPTRTIDIQRYVAVRVFGFKKQELSYDKIIDRVFDRRPDKNNVVF
jgi:hypothetical protein